MIPNELRFLNVDPLAADYASWSPYNYVLGNPISFIDPDGRSVDSPPHDYFDSDGNYIGSDNRGDEVRVVGNAELEQASSLSGDEKFKYLSENSKTFSKTTFKSKEAAGKIGQYYFNEYLGCNEVEVCGKANASFETLAMTFKGGSRISRSGDIFSSRSKPIIGVALSGYGRPYSDLLDNKYNFINILAHEYDHFNHVSFDGKTYSYHITDIRAGDIAAGVHLNTYWVQSKHWSFQKITPGLKAHFSKAVNDYINVIQNPRLKGLWQNVFKN